VWGNLDAITMREATEEVVRAVLRQTDNRVESGVGIASGGDKGETPEEAARRETREEVGIEPVGPWIALKPVLSLPVNVIRPDARKHWPGWLTTIPCYPFAIEASSSTVFHLSQEHSECRWAHSDEARALVHWDTDRVALTALEVLLRPDAGSRSAASRA
jgi:dihydroneopterin triphosphate diphosphatase